MGLVHDKLDNFEQAKEYHELALNIRHKKLEAEHVDVATSYNNLGLVPYKLRESEDDPTQVNVVIDSIGSVDHNSEDLHEFTDSSLAPFKKRRMADDWEMRRQKF